MADFSLFLEEPQFNPFQVSMSTSPISVRYEQENSLLEVKEVETPPNPGPQALSQGAEILLSSRKRGMQAKLAILQRLLSEHQEIPMSDIAFVPTFFPLRHQLMAAVKLVKDYDTESYGFLMKRLDKTDLQLINPVYQSYVNFTIGKGLDDKMAEAEHILTFLELSVSNNLALSLSHINSHFDQDTTLKSSRAARPYLETSSEPAETTLLKTLSQPTASDLPMNSSQPTASPLSMTRSQPNAGILPKTSSQATASSLLKSSSEPTASDLPKNLSQPTASALPKSSSEPTARDLSKTLSQPTASALPKSSSEPTARDLSKTLSQPTASALPKSSSEPTARDLPKTSSQPTASALPKSSSEPTARDLPKTLSQPTASALPMTSSKPIASFPPKTSSQPTASSHPKTKTSCQTTANLHPKTSCQATASSHPKTKTSCQTTANLHPKTSCQPSSSPRPKSSYELTAIATPKTSSQRTSSFLPKTSSKPIVSLNAIFTSQPSNPPLSLFTCFFCKREHDPKDCEEYPSPESKVTFCRSLERPVCWICFSSYHSSKECHLPRCEKCKLNHSVLLCCFECRSRSRRRDPSRRSSNPFTRKSSFDVSPLTDTSNPYFADIEALVNGSITPDEYKARYKAKSSLSTHSRRSEKKRKFDQTGELV